MLKHTLLPVATCTGLLLSGIASAVELTDVESAPRQYVKKVVVQDLETGEKSEQYHFGSSSVIWRPESLNNIFAAYGLAFDADYVDDVPKNYCHLVEVKNEDGEKEMVMKFNDRDAIIWEPKALDRILTAYGLSLDPGKIADLPRGYAALVEATNEDGETEQAIDFGNDNIIWSADKLNQILAAYN